MKKTFLMVPIALLVLVVALIAPASASPGYGQTLMSYSGIGSGSVDNPYNIWVHLMTLTHNCTAGILTMKQ